MAGEVRDGDAVDPADLAGAGVAAGVPAARSPTPDRSPPNHVEPVHSTAPAVTVTAAASAVRRPS
ncbi:hypothetical protein, partial [Streptomyces sp. SID8499]|uniref:hypothetical protein n=1 Tax=Streptomyces sp. SID8499 TaxID=2706106 RepID=UPI0019413915